MGPLPKMPLGPIAVFAVIGLIATIVVWAGATGWLLYNLVVAIVQYVGT